MGSIVLIFLFVVLFIVVCFFILILMGNLSAMKWLAKHGVAVFSKKIDIDSKLLNYVNPKESFCWLSIPDVCYCPVMCDMNGKYKDHNFLQKKNMYGEVFVSNRLRDTILEDISKKESDSFLPDLTVIKGNAKGMGNDLRHANFSQLRQLGKYIKEGKKNCVSFCKNGVLVKYSPIALIDISIGDKHSFEYKDRINFLNSLLNMSKIKSSNQIQNKNIVLLECKTDIDIVIVILEEGLV